MNTILKNKDLRWTIAWTVITVGVLVWDILFLNKPALAKVLSGFFNTFAIALLVVVFTLAMGWSATLVMHFLKRSSNRAPWLVATFMLNMVRSIPQIVGVLFGYVAISSLVQQEIITSPIIVFILMALCMSLFIFLELYDLMAERIDYFVKRDFYSAMRVCGISESRVVNFDILWKNSRLHIFNKLIAVLGYAVFLQCSVDFIISVGLSTDVNEVTMPTTLGSLLASIDSKQDILAIGYTLTHFDYAARLLFEHLQGMTVAFLIVFSLVSIYNIANGYAERNRL